MKKKIFKILIFIILIICCLMTLTGCGENKTTGNKVVETNQPKSFSINFYGVNVAPGSKFDENKISETANISEIPSCAFDGMDKVYTYSNMEITVAEIDGVSTVYSVYFIDETASTDEEVKISDSKDLMLEKYGENYQNSVPNKYDYIRGNIELSFIIENDIITGIEYTLLN